MWTQHRNHFHLDVDNDLCFKKAIYNHNGKATTCKPAS